MSMQSKFKIKRPHSPDHIGIRNYKKQRLIFDLENLSLHDDKNIQRQRHLQNSRRYPQYTEDSTSEGLYVPQTASGHPLKLLESEGSVLSDSELIYHKLKRVLREKSLQVIRWSDPRWLLYNQWFRWFQLHYESDLCMLSPEDRGSTKLDMEGDIEMDDA